MLAGVMATIMASLARVSEVVSVLCQPETSAPVLFQVPGGTRMSRHLNTVAEPLPFGLARNRVVAPAGTIRSEPARVAGTRRNAEERYKRVAGGAGPDQYEVRTRNVWHRRIPLGALARALREVPRMRASDRGTRGSSNHRRPHHRP